MDELTRLAVEAAAGDPRAFEAFVRATQADVRRLCAYLGDPAHADDLTQDVYLRVTRALPAFAARSSARTWLFSITRRACADHVRRSVRRRRLQQRIEQQPVDAVEPSGEAGTALDALIAELPDDYRTAFVLTQVIGCTYQEAADACGCPVGTIRSRVARAREALVSSLDDVASATGA